MQYNVCRLTRSSSRLLCCTVVSLVLGTGASAQSSSRGIGPRTTTDTTFAIALVVDRLMQQVLGSRDLSLESSPQQRASIEAVQRALTARRQRRATSGIVDLPVDLSWRILKSEVMPGGRVCADVEFTLEAEQPKRRMVRSWCFREDDGWRTGDETSVLGHLSAVAALLQSGNGNGQ